MPQSGGTVSALTNPKYLYLASLHHLDNQGWEARCCEGVLAPGCPQVNIPLHTQQDLTTHQLGTVLLFVLGLGLGVSNWSQPCGCIRISIALPRMLYMELKSGVLRTQSLKCSRGSIGKFLEQFKDSRWPKESIGTLLGCSTISDFITYKKLSFLLSIAALPPTALPRQVLQCRLQELLKAWIPLLETEINDLNLPNIATLLQITPSKSCWKKRVTEILGTRAHLHLLNQTETKCDLEQLSMCAPNLSSPSPLWRVTHCPDLFQQVGCFNHRVGAQVADKLERQWLWKVSFHVED